MTEYFKTRYSKLYAKYGPWLVSHIIAKYQKYVSNGALEIIIERIIGFFKNTGIAGSLPGSTR
jgi:hypothetical protein